MATDLRLKESLPALTERIVETYEECGGINHLGHSPLPSYREVVEILADLREILFPGYGRRQNLHIGNVAYHIGDLIDSLHDRLTLQIARALRHDCKAKELETDFEAEAQLIAIRLLESIPDLRRALAEDVQAAYEGDPAAKNLDEIAFCYPGVDAISVFRFAHVLFRLGVPLIPRMMTEYAHSKTGIDIHPGASIGRRFFIDHGTGVVIGETTQIGDGVKI
jgi:serine O-acetyltransferase